MKRLLLLLPTLILPLYGQQYVRSGETLPSKCSSSLPELYDLKSGDASAGLYICRSGSWNPVVDETQFVKRDPITGNVAISTTVLPGTAISTTADTSVTLVAANNGQIMRFTAGTDVTLTLNSDVAVAGFSILVVQRGAGVIVPTAGAGVTIRQRESKTKTAGRYATASIVCDLANDCVLSGDLQ